MLNLLNEWIHTKDMEVHWNYDTLKDFNQCMQLVFSSVNGWRIPPVVVYDMYLGNFFNDYLRLYGGASAWAIDS